MTVAAAAVVLAAYAVFLGFNVGAVAGGSDSSGYMNHAKLIASGHLHVQPRIVPTLSVASAPPYLYVPLGFRPASNGNGLVPTYPSGFPLFVVALKSVVGWRHAGDLAILLNSLAGLVATYALGRILGLGRRWSALGAVIVATSPLYLFMSLQAMSDVPSLFWTTAAVAVDVLVRPTNVLAFVPLAIALGASPRRWVAFLLGGLPGAAFFALHSHAAYGSFAATGYGNSSSQFMAAYVPGTLRHYGKWLPVLFTPLAVAFLALPWVRSAAPKARVLLVSWVVLYAAFYSSYECTHETWWYLRFLLPAAPALVVGSLLALQAALRRAPAYADPCRSAAALVALIALVVGFAGTWTHRLYVLGIGRDELRYGLVTDWMKAHVPEDAVCLSMQATGALLYYTKFTFIRWDVLDKENIKGVDAALRASKRPIYAVLFPFEVNESGALDKRMPGHWTEVGKVEGVTLWRRDLGPSQP